jgi:ribosomal-protein-alanine N-acetyltransferase
MKDMIIRTGRLVLAPLLTTNASLSEMVGWLNNPLVVRFSEQRHRKHTMDSQLDYINSFKGEDTLLGIHLQHALIGTISARIDVPNEVANVGLMIGDHEAWGFGYGLEAWSGFCEKLLDNNVRKIEAGCMLCNVSMMSICLRYGMMEEGRLEDHFIYRKIPISMVLWGKVK